VVVQLPFFDNNTLDIMHVLSGWVLLAALQFATCTGCFGPVRSLTRPLLRGGGNTGVRGGGGLVHYVCFRKKTARRRGRPRTEAEQRQRAGERALLLKPLNNSGDFFGGKFFTPRLQIYEITIPS
jgi:hypothetical protein